jgi:large subunit ribosomal protein L22
MTGPKTNEGARSVLDDTGTRATARYVRVSSSKAREVLDQIRGLDVRSADEVLQFLERDVAIVVRKCLASAVANAEHNDNLSSEELYVSACFADEGPTLKRFRPRARGRASRIRKRTTHITVLVKRYSDEQLELRRRAEEARPASTRTRRTQAAQASSRAQRVAKSRKAAAAATDHDHDHDHEGHDHDHDDHDPDEVETVAEELDALEAAEELEAEEVEADEIEAEELEAEEETEATEDSATTPEGAAAEDTEDK